MKNVSKRNEEKKLHRFFFRLHKTEMSQWQKLNAKSQNFTPTLCGYSLAVNGNNNKKMQFKPVCLPIVGPGN